jgi:hypothetical protein
LLVLRSSADDPLWRQAGLDHIRLAQLLPPLRAD